MKQRIIIISLIVLCILNIGCAPSPQETTQEKTKIEFSTINDIDEPRIAAIKKMDMVDLLEKAKEYKIPKVKKSKSVEITSTESTETVVEPVEIVEPVETVTEPIEQEEVFIDAAAESIVEEPVIQDQEYNDEDINTDDLTQESGVNYYDGRTETYYSSNSLYHQDTDQWTVDEEGFYRTDEGYYVVAASDMPQGTTFEGSKGTCVVLDDGCEEGTTDYYTNW